MLNMKKRFSGYLPIVVDVETSGLNANTDALLEIAAFLLDINEQGKIQPGKLFACHVLPFEGANLDPTALEINGIDPYYPLRFAIPEKQALNDLTTFVQRALDETQCRRALLVGHNAHFDLNFLQASIKRCQTKERVFHSFTCLDTATLSSLAFGKTVLARALKCAHIPFNKEEAHSAIYDAQKTAELFCYIVNNTTFRNTGHT